MKKAIFSFIIIFIAGNLAFSADIPWVTWAPIYKIRPLSGEFQGNLALPGSITHASFAITSGFSAGPTSWGLVVEAMHGYQSPPIKPCDPSDPSYWCIPEHFVPHTKDLRLFVYENGTYLGNLRATLFGQGPFGSQSYTIENITSFALQPGRIYTFLLGLYYSHTLIKPDSLVANNWVHWLFKNNGVSEAKYGEQGAALYPSSFSVNPYSNLDEIPREFSFVYLPNALPTPNAAGTSQWNGSGAKSTNYGSRIDLNDAGYAQVTWVLEHPASGWSYAPAPQTQPPFNFHMPDLTDHPTLAAIEDGYRLTIHATDIYGRTASSIYNISSLRSLTPRYLLFDFEHYHDLDTTTNNPVCKDENVLVEYGPRGLRLTNFNRTSNCQNIRMMEVVLKEIGNHIDHLIPFGPGHSNNYTIETAAVLEPLDSDCHVPDGVPRILDDTFTQLNDGSNRQVVPVMEYSINNKFRLWSMGDINLPSDYVYPFSGTSANVGQNFIEFGIKFIKDNRSLNEFFQTQGSGDLVNWLNGTLLGGFKPYRFFLGSKPGTSCGQRTLHFFDAGTCTNERTLFLLNPPNAQTIHFKPTYPPGPSALAYQYEILNDGNVGFQTSGSGSFPSNGCHAFILPSSVISSLTPNEVYSLRFKLYQDSAMQDLIVSGNVLLAVPGSGGDPLASISYAVSTGDDPSINVNPASSEFGKPNFFFNLAYTGNTPQKVHWKWSANVGGTAKFWNGNSWVTSDPGFAEVGYGNVSNNSHAGWEFLLATYAVKVKLNTAPFASHTTAFFQEGLGPVTVTAKVQHSGGMTNEKSVTLDIEPAGATHHLTGFAGSFDGASFYNSQFTVPGGTTPVWKFRVYSPDTLNQSSTIQFSLTGTNPLTCASALTHFSIAHVSGAYYELTPKATATQLLGLLAEKGTHTFQIYDGSCGTASSALRLVMMIQGDGRVLVRLHYRDHLGSSTASKAFTVDPATVNELPNMTLASGGQSLGLFAKDPEWNFYKPFGGRLNQPVEGQDDARYTDHEYDGALDLNYMKGRYQLAYAAKFNRPDPMRDWDWTSPHTLNLYEYVGNDPINGSDPTGFFGGGYRPAKKEVHPKLGNETAEAALRRAAVSTGRDPNQVVGEFRQAIAGGPDLYDVAGMFYEPIDWALIAVDVAENGPHWSHATAALPFVPFGAMKNFVKAADYVTDSATPLARVADTPSGVVEDSVQALGQGAGDVQARFMVTPDGVVVPTNPTELVDNLSQLTDVSTNPASSKKFLGEDGNGPMRVRVEKAHPDDPNFSGTPDPLHTVDHIHIDRRTNGTSGKWKSEEKFPYVWPFL